MLRVTGVASLWRICPGMGLTLTEGYPDTLIIGYSEIIKGQLARGYSSKLATLFRHDDQWWYRPSWRESSSLPCPGLDINDENQIKDLVLTDLGDLLGYLKVLGPYIYDIKVHSSNVVIQTVEANEYGLFRVSQTRGVKLTRTFVSAFMLFRTWEYQEPFNAPFDTSGLEEHMELIKTTPLRRL